MSTPALDRVRASVGSLDDLAQLSMDGAKVSYLPSSTAHDGRLIPRPCAEFAGDGVTTRRRADPRCQDLGMNVGQRARLRKWSKAHAAVASSAPAAGGSRAELLQACPFPPPAYPRRATAPMPCRPRRPAATRRGCV